MEEKKLRLVLVTQNNEVRGTQFFAEPTIQHMWPQGIHKEVSVYFEIRG